MDITSRVHIKMQFILSHSVSSFRKVANKVAEVRAAGYPAVSVLLETFSGVSWETKKVNKLSEKF